MYSYSDTNEGVLLIAMLLFGLIGGYIYQSKGNSFFIGCLLGALLGPIGWLIGALRRPSKELLERQGVITGPTKQCPYCAELVKEEAVVCKHCGREIQDM